MPIPAGGTGYRDINVTLGAVYGGALTMTIAAPTGNTALTVGAARSGP